jgi:hypothetical protein
MSLHNEKSARVLERERREKFQTSNSHTLRRYGPLEEGIDIQCDGLSMSDPRKTYVEVGPYRVSRDKDFGCSIFKRGAGREIRRVFPIKIVREGKRTFYRLKNPGNGELHYSVIKVFLRSPECDTVVMNDRALRVHVGFSSDGCNEIAHITDEALLVLHDGEQIAFYFPDGHVRVFQQANAKLVEVELTPTAMVRVRIADARKRLAVAKAIENEELRIKRVRYVLVGMVDMLQLTSRNRGNGKALREILLQEFFLTLPKTDVDLVLSRLIEVFKLVDSTLVTEFRNAQQKVMMQLRVGMPVLSQV